MNKRELKALIKEMVRESLTEIFVEMKLENIVERVVRQQNPMIVEEATPRVVYQQPQRQQAQPKQIVRENLRNKMAISDDEWKGIYEDVDVERMPSGMSTTVENPEFVSEDDMRKLGLF